MTHAQHAEQARTRVRALGAADCIHYAPNWSARADALYDQANLLWTEQGLEWLKNGGGSPALLADGRMVVICEDVWLVEPTCSEAEIGPAERGILVMADRGGRYVRVTRERLPYCATCHRVCRAGEAQCRPCANGEPVRW